MLSTSLQPASNRTTVYRATTTSAARATAPPVPLTADFRRAEHFASRSNNIRCPEVAPPGKGLRGQSPIYCSTHSPTSRCMLTHAFLLCYTRQLGNDAIYLGYRTLSATRDVEVRFPATRAQRRNLAYRNRRRSSNVRQLYATVWISGLCSLSLSPFLSHHAHLRNPFEEPCATRTLPSSSRPRLRSFTRAFQLSSTRVRLDQETRPQTDHYPPSTVKQELTRSRRVRRRRAADGQEQLRLLR